MKQFILGLILALCTFAVNAQALWQTANYGMSVAQVSKLFPDAKGVVGEPQILASGAEALLVIENVSLADHSFKVNFYFKSKKLEQITLSLTEAHPYQVALGIFDRLADSLRMKYGKETSHKTSSSLITSAEMSWLAGKTNIGLNVFAIGQGDAKLKISYQARASKDADKL